MTINERPRRRRVVALAAGALVVAAALGGGIVLVSGGGEPHRSLAPGTSMTAPTEAPPTTTTTPAPSTKVAAPVEVDAPAPVEAPVRVAPDVDEGVEPAKVSYSLDTIGPSTYGPLRLSMSGRAARATGLLGAAGHGDGDCTRYEGTFGGSVVVSKRFGVVAIRVTRPVATARGIHLGSTVADVRAAYPEAWDYRMGLKAGNFEFVIGGPGDYYTPWPDARPVIGINISTNSDCAFAI